MLLSICGIIFILLGLLLLLSILCWGGRNNNKPIKEDKNPLFAILIPARYESSVIEGLFKSIKKQTYEVKMEDVYVIVESMDDPTVKIASKYNISVILRHHLDLRRKGYALDEAIKEILKKEKVYDAYVILDADNILDEHFLSMMANSYKEGYDAVTGYRNSKNGNESVIAGCSSMTFSMLNTVINKRNIKRSGNVILSGTGFFIRSKWINKWQGYPFHSLTEDYELTLYSILHEMETSYNDQAIFYDEQPISFKESMIQRTRWVRGFFEARKIYVKKIRKEVFNKSLNQGSKITEAIGIAPYLLLVIGVIILLFSQLLRTGYKKIYFINSLIIILIVYLILWLFTYYMLKKENDKLNLSKAMKWKVLFMNPLFLASYVPCVVKAICKPNGGWDKIEHRTTKITKN